MKVKYCPFCGSEDRLTIKQYIDSNNIPIFWIMCLSCQAEGPSTKSKEESIKLWNDRFGLIEYK